MMNKKEKTNLQTPNWTVADGAGKCQIAENNAIAQRIVVTSSEKAEKIRNLIKNKYAEISKSAMDKFQYPTGKDGLHKLKYDSTIINRFLPGLLESFCGVGNPFSLGRIKPGDTVLDFGSGTGVDLLVASELVGEQGRICGIDLTAEMVEQAKKNLIRANVSNIEIKKVDSEDIPYPDFTFDVVISNAVINLSPDKKRVFKEIYRVLKPGGKLQFADVVLKTETPPNLSGDIEAWSEWIGGTIPVREQINLLKEAGFRKVEYVGTTGFHTSKYTTGALFRALK